MGYPMAGHLSKNENIDLFVYNRSPDPLGNWLKKYKGTEFILNNSADIEFDGFIVCLKDDAAIIDVLINKMLISKLKNKAFIIDHSTTSLELISSINSVKEMDDKSISFYDAPISGGEAGAVNGTLSVMFGGPAEKIISIKKLMRSYSSSIVHIGPSGHGQLTKMVNQLCIAGLLQGLSEGMAFGRESKLNMIKVFDAISNGAAQSWQMNNRYKSMLKDEFNFGFAVDLMIKDLKIALNESKNNQLDLNTSKEVLKNYQNLSDNGCGDLDTSSLIKIIK